MKKANKKIKVLVAMSGGVDSSVAAALLVRSKKYEVTGAYMVNYDDKNEQLKMNNEQIGRASCWVPDYRDALRVAAHLGIPLLKFDFIKEYKERVLDSMYAQYEAGRTPNPDVLCNTFVKFGSWLERAKELGFEYLATGHYAQVKKLAINNKQLTSDKKNHGASRLFVAHCSLLVSRDANKDQTYFLHQLNQEQLGRTMFPIGKYTKPQVRALAQKFGLPTAQKEESMGICFVGEVSMKEFLEKKIKPKIGKIVTTSGEVVGQHDGLPFYTVGQRSGLSLNCHFESSDAGGEKSLSEGELRQRSLAVARDDNRPLFVVAKRLKTNELVVGYEDDPLLYKKEIAIADVHWTSGQTPKLPLICEVRLRHRQPLQNAKLKMKNENFVIEFKKPQRAVTPGQFAVFYKGGECLGGGVIE